MSTSIVIKCLRPAMMQGEPVEAGGTRRVTALQAAEAVASGRFALVHADDKAACREALDADTLRTLRQAGAGRGFGASPGSPWMPLN